MTTEPAFLSPEPELVERVRAGLDAHRQAVRARRYSDLMEMLHGPPATAGERREAARHLGKDIGE